MRRLLLILPLFLLLLGVPTSVQAQGPQLRVTSPEEGANVTGDSVTVTFESDNFEIIPSIVPATEAGQRPEVNRPGEGHVHFILDLQPVVIWDRSEPITFDNVAPGEHFLTAELVNMDHTPLSPPVVQQVRFSVEAPGILPTTGANPTSLPSLLLLLGFQLTAIALFFVAPAGRRVLLNERLGNFVSVKRRGYSVERRRQKDSCKGNHKRHQR